MRSDDIDADHDAAKLDDLIREFDKPEILLPGMLPDGWEVGPFGPMRTRSAANAIKLLAANAKMKRTRAQIADTLAYMHTAPGITLMSPKFHAKMVDVPWPKKRAWWRRVLKLSFLARLWQ